MQARISHPDTLLRRRWPSSLPPTVCVLTPSLSRRTQEGSPGFIAPEISTEEKAYVRSLLPQVLQPYRT